MLRETGHQYVGVGVADDAIAAVAADEQIAAIVAVHQIIPIAADDDVIARAGLDRIIASPTEHDNVLGDIGIDFHLIIARTGGDDDLGNAAVNGLHAIHINDDRAGDTGLDGDVVIAGGALDLKSGGVGDGDAAALRAAAAIIVADADADRVS